MDSSPVSYLTYAGSGTVMRDVTVNDWCYAAIDRAVRDMVDLIKG
jgi:hypothetical protein